MAAMQGLCSECNQPIAVHVSQSVWDTRLRWHRAYHCPDCGAAIEEDGLGDTPTAIRRAILDAEGTWALRVDEQGERALLVMKALYHDHQTGLHLLTDRHLDMGVMRFIVRSAGAGNRDPQM